MVPIGKRYRLLFALLALGVAGALAGCEKQLPANRFDVISGTVQSLHADIGQLTLHSSSPRFESGNPYVHCLLSGDAEVYINDQFSTIGAIAVGDTAELIGYRDPNRPERFLVCLVHITRSESLPPAPDLSVASAQDGASVPSATVVHAEQGGGRPSR